MITLLACDLRLSFHTNSPLLPLLQTSDVYINPNLVEAFPSLMSYCDKLNRMQSNHDENISQRARILFRMLRWSVVDSVLFSDLRHEPDVQRPAIDFNALTIAANNCPNSNVLSAIS